MKFLRSVAGYSLMCRKRNEVIGEELEIFSLTDETANFRRNCNEHISVGWTTIRYLSELHIIFPEGIETGEDRSQDGLNRYNLVPEEITPWSNPCCVTVMIMMRRSIEWPCKRWTHQLFHDSGTSFLV